jgi:ABC-type sulfate transport system permease subunit
MTAWLELLARAAGDGLILCLEIAAVVIPLLLGYELAKAYGVFARPWPGVGPVLGRMGLSPGALVPLLAGIFLGLLYGAAILLAMSKEQGLSERERLALGVFLVTCHAVVEDTAIFVLLGGSAFWMLGPRVVLAVALTAWLARRGGRVDPSAKAGI